MNAINKPNEVSMFKAGDKVLIIDSYFGNSLYTIREIVQRADFVSLALFDESGFFRLSGIRHATPEEIQLGRRIEQDCGCNHDFEEVTKYGDAHKTYMCTICEFRDEQVK